MTTTVDLRLAPREPDVPDDGRGRVVMPEGRSVELSSGRTFARVHVEPGARSTILLLHGWTATADLTWFTSYPSLISGCNVVAIDHRGHGRGLRTKERFTLADCADDAAELLDRLGLGPAIAVGYSMGGPIAQLLWRRHPDKVDATVLCATAATFNTTSRERALFAAVGGVAAAARVLPRPLRELTGSGMLTGRTARDLRIWASSEIARHDWLRIIQAGQAIGSYDARRWLRDLDVPASIIVTTNDDVVHSDRQYALAGLLADVEIFEIDAPHSACISNPPAFTRALEAAIASVEHRIDAIAD